MKNLLFALCLVSLHPDVFSQALSSDTIHWKGNHKLDWKDFTGTPPKSANGKVQVTMVMDAKFHKVLRSTTTVETILDRKKSWISKELQTEQELKYYQVMFNLYEVESRKLRKQFKETKLGLDPEKVFHEKYNAALAALDERSKQYMEETDTGTDATELEKWNKTLEQELKQLEAYK